MDAPCTKVLFFVARKSGAKCLFLLIVAAAAIQQCRSRVGLFLGAVMAAGLPAVTACKIKIGAVAGKGPAVMKGPDDFLTAGAQVIKQQTDMDVITMNIMEPDHIRIIFPNPV